MLLPFALERPTPLQEALATLALAGNIEERGAVFTKGEVVNGILDLCGYVPSRDLLSLRLLEPSFGEGEFLLAAVTRLLASCRAHHGSKSNWLRQLQDRVRAVELHEPTFQRTRDRLLQLLRDQGLTEDESESLVTSWLTQDDFLLTSLSGSFDVAAGNPPYVRQERIPNVLLAEYKRRYATLYDRADLYVLFYERCLDLLKPHGVLGFICANRWVKNKYGGPLRAKISEDFNLDYYIDLERVDAFHEQVDAYPAITIIRRAPPSETAVVTQGRNGAVALDTIFPHLLKHEGDTSLIARVRDVGHGRAPWLIDAPEILKTVRALEHQLPTLEQAGARVGIGVATGADRIYIGKYDELPVEEERRLPLVMSADLKPTGLDWSGHGLVNPWAESGELASLEDYPLFAAYLMKHETQLKNRHTAKKSPKSWYKTIDRVYPELTKTPKLLIPDIKGEAMVVYDEGAYYPHHNLYVVTSNEWDLRALQTVLKSSVALMFVAAYCVRMSGGFLRFQAQYLRRIRIPRWKDLSEHQRSALHEIAASTEQDKIDDVVFEVFGLSEAQASKITTFAASARVRKETQ